MWGWRTGWWEAAPARTGGRAGAVCGPPLLLSTGEGTAFQTGTSDAVAPGLPLAGALAAIARRTGKIIPKSIQRGIIRVCLRGGRYLAPRPGCEFIVP